MIRKHQRYEDNLGKQENKYLIEIETFNRKMMEFEQEIKELKKAG